MRPLYRKVFSRNFTLATIQIWLRAETVDDKKWTKEIQPFLPYIVFENLNGKVAGYYDMRGVKWIKNLLIDRCNSDSKFIGLLERRTRGSFREVQKIFEEKSKLNLKELREFFLKLQHLWVWFEAGWWIWELSQSEKKRIKAGVPQTMYVLREDTQDVVSRSEELIKNSFKDIFPKMGELSHFLTLEEINGKNLPDNKVLKGRADSCFLTTNKLHVGVTKLFIESEYGIKLEHQKVEVKTKVIRGKVAYAGVVEGLVKVVLTESDMVKVCQGDILVSPMTLPNLLQAIRKAGAIVTDEGGIMCHASIISRELEKPCIIGTKIATKVLKDGDLVEVNARSGVIKIIKRVKK